MKRFIIFLCLVLMLVGLPACDMVVDRESQAFEFEAIALVRTLRFDPNATATNAPVIIQPTSTPVLVEAQAFSPTKILPEPAEPVSDLVVSVDQVDEFILLLKPDKFPRLTQQYTVEVYLLCRQPAQLSRRKQ